jgi:1,4-alpha-glucan branching enzyme
LKKEGMNMAERKKTAGAGKKEPAKKIVSRKKATAVEKKPVRRVDVKGNERDVKFVFKGPDALEVYLAGEFNGWDMRSLPMKRNRKGEWSITVALPPGQHEYNFVVDGTWVQDPACSERVMNPFGTQNCIMQVY